MSHLAVFGFEAAASDDLVLASPSLLLYKGLEVGDLMSELEDVWEGMADFEVEDRSSILSV